MIDFLNNIDTEIFLFFNGHHTLFLDRFMILFTGRFIWIPMYAVIFVIMMRALRPRTAVFYILALVAAIAITDQTCASLIRPVVERLRPSNLENPLSALTQIVGGYRGGSYGFPSCHAANSFALATFLSLTVRRRGFVAFIIGWALLNSYSRLYLGVHYPGDLFAGAVAGALIAGLCFLTVSRLCGGDARERALAADRPIIILPLRVNIGSTININALMLNPCHMMMLVGGITAAIIALASTIGGVF